MVTRAWVKWQTYILSGYCDSPIQHDQYYELNTLIFIYIQQTDILSHIYCNIKCIVFAAIRIDYNPAPLITYWLYNKNIGLVVDNFILT